MGNDGSALHPDLHRVVSANLTVDPGVPMTLDVFARDGRARVIALSKGLGLPGVPLVRIHSSCFTGDVLTSMRCDCGAQLRMALAAICVARNGALLYMLDHEGRGIGLINKIRAYALQDKGADTVEANLQLGFAADARDYTDAVSALRNLGVHRVRILTNNMSKVAALEAGGLEVVERLPHQAGVTPFNSDYLHIKRDLLGHQLILRDVDLTDANGGVT